MFGGGDCCGGGAKLLGFLQVPEKMLGFEVGILEKSDGQLTPNQFLPKSPQQRDLH